MEIDGSNVRQLTNNPWHNAHPDWSPDGTKIAFYSGWNLVVMDWDGSNFQKLPIPPKASLPEDPDWSPDGKKIAFSARGVSKFDIWISPQVRCATSPNIQRMIDVRPGHQMVDG